MADYQGENRIRLRGSPAAAPVFSHRNHGTDYYLVPLRVPRLSGNQDVVNLITTCPDPQLWTPEGWVETEGEVRSYNNRTGVGSRLVITVLAREIRPGLGEPCNRVTLWGALCKPPVLRRTPLGRDICDLLLAVGRRYRRADYLPCIAWGGLALRCARLSTGDPLGLEGRLQSRTYQKTVEGVTQERTAFEISITRVLEEDGAL